MNYFQLINVISFLLANETLRFILVWKECIMFGNVLGWNSRQTRPKIYFSNTNHFLTLFLFKQKIDDFCVRPWNEILHHHMNVLKFEKYSENFLTTILLTAHFLGYYNFEIAILENFAQKGHSWRKIKIDKSANSVDVSSIVNIFMVFCFLRNDEKWKHMPLAKIIFMSTEFTTTQNIKMLLAQQH